MQSDFPHLTGWCHGGERLSSAPCGERVSHQSLHAFRQSHGRTRAVAQSGQRSQCSQTVRNGAVQSIFAERSVRRSQVRQERRREGPKAGEDAQRSDDTGFTAYSNETAVAGGVPHRRTKPSTTPEVNIPIWPSRPPKVAQRAAGCVILCARKRPDAPCQARNNQRHSEPESSGPHRQRPGESSSSLARERAGRTTLHPPRGLLQQREPQADERTSAGSCRRRVEGVRQRFKPSGASVEAACTRRECQAESAPAGTPVCCAA